MNNDDKRNRIIMIILIGIILLESLFISIKDLTIALYFGGFLFLMAGHFIGMNEKGFGLIFLFSHGVSGICCMLSAILNDIVNTPMINDLPTKAYYYFGATIAVFICSIVYVIVYNLNDKLKEKEYSKFIPLVLYAIGFAMAGLFHIVINYL